MIKGRDTDTGVMTKGAARGRDAAATKKGRDRFKKEAANRHEKCREPSGRDVMRGDSAGGGDYGTRQEIGGRGDDAIRGRDGDVTEGYDTTRT